MLKAFLGEILDGNEKQVIENWKKGDPCYKRAKKLTDLCSSILWNMEVVNDEIRYLAEEISKHNVESETRAPWLLTVKCKRRAMN